MAQDVLGRSSGKETFSKVILFFPVERLETEIHGLLIKITVTLITLITLITVYSLKLIMIPVSSFRGRSSVCGTGLYYNYANVSADSSTKYPTSEYQNPSLSK